MAAISLPPPGSEHGPCVPTCNHTDCAATRRDANSLCVLCGSTIGYDTRFYSGRDVPEDDRAHEGQFVHADCLEDYADKQDRERGVGKWA